MSENVNIKHIEDSVSNIGIKQICIETGNDSQTGHRMWAGKDSAGNTYKFLGKGKPAYIQNLNISDFATAGLLRTDAIGDIFGDVNTLGELNTALGGTTIDESTDARPPDPHATDHTDGTDDIQDATASQKGIMTAAQAAQLIQNTSDISTAQSDISTNANDISTNAGAISVNQSNISTNTTNISTNAGDITTNAGNIATNTSDIAALMPDPEFEDVPWEQVVTNGNFDTDVTSWTVGNSATVTWQSGGIARIAYNGVTNPFISQAVLEIGTEYVFAGRARGDGANFPTLEASGVVWTALDAAEWQEFIIIFTATSTTMALTSGGATSGYVEWDYQYARAFSNIPITDKTATWITRENLFSYPLDLSNASWGKTGCTIDSSTGVMSAYVDPVLGQVEFDGLIANVGTGAHYMVRAAILAEEVLTFSFLARPGATDFMVLENASVGGKRFYCNLSTLEIGTLPAGINVELSRTCCGEVEILATFPSVVGSNTMIFGPVTSLTGGNVNGDGTTINTYLTKMHLHNGAKESSVGFYNGGAAAYPRTLSLEYPDDYQLKHANGKALTADGAWVYLSDISGFPMDESPSNVAVMHAAGIYKVVSDNTWGPLVAGTQFYAPSGNFLELFEDTSVASGAHTLTPSATPPTDNLASPIHSTGTVYHANYAVMVPSYTSATTFSGLKNNGTEMQLVFSTDGYTTALGYRIEVEYEWRAIVAPS